MSAVETYKGYSIEISREDCMGGWPMTYFDVFRVSDGLHVIGNFSEAEDSIDSFVDDMKSRVDEFIKTKGASEEMEEDFKS